MKFKIDENLPNDVLQSFRNAGHDIHSVHDEDLAGEPDSAIIAACSREGRCLITFDLDFSDTRTYPPNELQGIIIFRLRSQDKQSVLRIIPNLLQMIANEPVTGRLWIVEDQRVRIRGGE